MRKAKGKEMMGSANEPHTGGEGGKEVAGRVGGN